MSKTDFLFRNEHLCFTLLDTLSRRGSPTLVERLEQPSDLARLCVEAGLMLHQPAATENDLRDATALRESIQKVGEALVARDLPDPADIDVINRCAAITPLAPVASADASTAQWKGDDVSAAMSLVARDAILVYTTMPRDRLRICEDPSCTGLFLDESRPGKRRWCSMSLCGDRHKKKRFRSKPKSVSAH